MYHDLERIGFQYIQRSDLCGLKNPAGPAVGNGIEAILPYCWMVLIILQELQYWLIQSDNIFQIRDCLILGVFAG
jgi:hypothetical protein